MQLASRFASRSPVLRSDYPLSDDQIRTVAPSIFADAPHQSRSERYSYVPTATVLEELRGEGFEPFMVCQTRVRQDARRDYTKHMIRLRHASQINGREANEIILLNSHDGTSSYQMLAGMFRFVCSNGLVCGDIDLPHDVPKLNRSGRRPALLYLGAKGSQIFSLNFGQQAVLESRQKVPVNDVLARGTGAVGPPCIGQPCLQCRAEGLDGDHPAFLALLFKRGRYALGNGFPRVQEQFARHRQ